MTALLKTFAVGLLILSAFALVGGLIAVVVFVIPEGWFLVGLCAVALVAAIYLVGGFARW